MNRADPLIAVIDDEAPVRTMLGRVLRLASYRVNAYASGEDFLASLVAELPACAVLDLHMPGLSGFQVQARMRNGNIAVPVVFITASDEVALDRSVQEAGGIRLLRKPFSSDELLEAIATAMSRNAGGSP